MGLVEADDGLVQHVLLLPAPSGLALPEHGQGDDERRRGHEGLVEIRGPDLAQVVVDGGRDGAVLVRGQDVVQVGLGGILLELDVEAHANGTVGDDDAGTALGLLLRLLVPSCRGIGVGRTAANLGHAGEGGGRGHDCAGRHRLAGTADDFFGLLLVGSVLCSIVQHIYLRRAAEQIDGGHVLLKTGYRGGRLVLLILFRSSAESHAQKVDLTAATSWRGGDGIIDRRRAKAQQIGGIGRRHCRITILKYSQASSLASYRSTHFHFQWTGKKLAACK